MDSACSAAAPDGGSSRVRHGSGRLRSAIVIGLGCAAASTAGVPAAPQVIVNQPGGLALLPSPRSRRRTSSRAMSGRFWRQARIRAEPAQRLAEGNFVRGSFPMTGPPQVRRARRAPIWPASRCPDRPGRRRAPRGSAYGVADRGAAPGRSTGVAPRVSGDHLKGDRRSATRRAGGAIDSHQLRTDRVHRKTPQREWIGPARPGALAARPERPPLTASRLRSASAVWWT